MASLPQVGLEAIIAGLPGFNAGAKAIVDAYNNIEKRASNVEKATNIMGNAFSSISSPISSLANQFVGLGQGVLKFGAIAGGAALLGVTALTAGIIALGTSAVGEFAKYERMSLSIQNLVAREISQGQVVEQQIQTRIGLTQKETDELSKLPQAIQAESLSRQTLAAQIQEQRQRIIELTASYGDNGLNVQTAKAKLAEMENEYAQSGQEIDKLNGRISELNNKNGQLTTVLQKVRVGQVSMTDAMTQAAPKAQELLKWIQLLAIQSPFNQEDVANAFQTAMAYGFTTDMAQRLTTASLDYAAATGKSGEVTGQIALALGQMQAKGKVSGQELIQLTNAGVGVNKILNDMGFTLDDVSNGLVSADDFIQATIKDMEVFRGAGKQQSTTFAGLIASLQDIKGFGLREFFSGTFNAIQPYLVNFVDGLTAAIFQTGAIKQLGDTLGQYVGGALQRVSGFITLIQNLGMGAGLTIFNQIFGPQGIALWVQVETLIGNISGTISNLGTAISTNLSGPVGNFASQIIPMITQGLAIVNQNFEAFKGALLGVGAVLGVGVFAALVAGILSLLAPINLIIAGAALLGAAWAGNWGDIQGKTFAAWAAIQPILQQTYDWLAVNIPLAIQTASTFWTTTLQPAMLTVWSWISGTLVPTFIEIYNWLFTNLPIGIQNLSNMWTNTLLPAVMAVWSWYTSNLVPLFESVNNLIGAVLTKTLTVFAGLWQNVLLPAVTKVWSMIQSNLLPVFGSIGEKASGDIIPPLLQMGEEVLPLLAEGLDYVSEAIKKAIDFFNSLASAVSSFSLPDVLTPGSPPPMANALMDIAKASGVAKGSIDALTQGVSNSSKTFGVMMTKTMHLQSQLSKALMPKGQKQDITHLVQNLLPQYAGSFEGGQFGTGTLLQGIGQGLKAIGSSVGIGQVVDAMKKAGYSIQNVTNQMSAAFIETQKVIRLQNAAKAVGVAGQLVQFGQTAADRLNARIETLQKIVDSGTEGNYKGQIIDATMAQEELNKALDEQSKIQQQINDLQRQQADLQFLQQQISLIQMIKESGLNVKDILGGITLGLDASIPDIVTAMNNVVQAMINQIDEDLQIQSPSKVMFKKMGQVTAGMAKGLVGGIPNLLSSTTQAIRAGIINVPAALVGGGGDTYNSTSNYNLSVGTLDSASAVVGQFQVMRSMA